MPTPDLTPPGRAGHPGLPDRPRPPARRRTPRASVAAFALALVGTAAACAPAPAPAPAPSSGDSATEAQVTVVHGLRGQLVDVYLDGKLLLDAFKPDRLTDPMSVPIGSHTVDLRPAGTPATDAPKATATADLTPGPVSIVAHFAPGGGWTMSLFTNDVGTLGAGTGKVVFRNTAAVSPVAVSLSGASAVPPIDVGKEADETLPAASYAVKVGGADGATLLPDDDISVDAGKALILYLVGQGDNLTWLSQKVSGSAAAPAAVRAGNSGLLGAAGANAWSGAALVVAGLVVAGSGVVTSRSRRRIAA